MPRGTESCLSPQQVGALTKAFAGPKNSRGTQVYPAFPWDSGIDAQSFIPGILRSAGSSPVNPKAYPTIDVDAIQDRSEANGITQLTDTVKWTNLTSFFAHGGKILYFHGWSDPWFSPLDTLQYYEKMAKDSGGPGQGARAIEPFLRRARHAPLRRRSGARQFRPADRGGGLGRARQSAGLRRRDRPHRPRPLAPALRLAATRTVQGLGRQRRRGELQMRRIGIGEKPIKTIGPLMLAARRVTVLRNCYSAAATHQGGQ